MEKTTGFLAALLSAVMLSGCSRLMLEQRTFIRDIFIRETTEGISVALWQEEEEQLTEGEGSTLREALYQAENQLDGEPFYGQNQRIILDADLPWERLKECGTHFTAEENRMPNVTLWFGQELPKGENCKAYLEQLEALENQYSLTANLYELTRREKAVILPCFDGEALQAAAKTSAKTLEWQQPYALLTLILAQQASSGTAAMDTPYGELLMEIGGAVVAMETDGNALLVRVSVKNAGWRLLDSAETLSKETVERILRERSELWIQEIQNQQTDFFFLSQHLKNLNQPMADRLERNLNDIPINFVFELQ